MIRNKIWYLAFLSPLGLLAIPLRQPLLYLFFQFAMFVAFYRIDERDLATMGRAALVSFFVSILAYVAAAEGLFITVGKMPKPADIKGWDAWQVSLITYLAISLFSIIIVSVITFLASYFYLNRRGLRA